MKISSRLIPWTLGLATMLALATVPAFAADDVAVTPAAEAVVEAPAPTSGTTPEATPDSLASEALAGAGIPEAQPVSTYGTCRVRCGFEFYSYQTTYSGCCGSTQYCPDGSTGFAVAWNGMRCPP